MDLDLDLPPLGDNGPILPEAEAFPETLNQDPAETGFLRSSSAVPEEEESSEFAEAPQRRRPRAPRELPTDMTQELRNADLAQWNNNYIANMTSAAHSKSQHKAPMQSKKNAAFLIYGTGIGGVGSGVGSSKLPNPLDIFAGDRLMQALTGVEASTVGRKRSRSKDDDHGSDSEERRVRLREGDGEQVGRGQEIILDEDDAMGMMGSEVRSFAISLRFGSSFVRRSRSVATLHQHSKTNPPNSRGTYLLRPDASVKAPSHVAMASLAASAASPPVPAIQAPPRAQE